MNRMSKVDIANSALHLIGGGIALINLEEERKEAKIISRIFDSVRQSVLAEERAEWSFAIKHRLLDVSADDNPTEYEYNYVLPADCIKPIVIDDYEGYPYTVEAGHFYCDIPAATLKYIYDIEDLTKLSPGFVRAFTHKLAVDIAAALEKDTTFIYQKYQLELNKAIGQDLRSSRNKYTRPRKYTNVRFDYRGREY